MNGHRCSFNSLRPLTFPHLSIFILPKQNYTAEVNCLVALHELYKYINKYYDQVSITKVQKHHSWVVCYDLLWFKCIWMHVQSFLSDIFFSCSKMQESPNLHVSLSSASHFMLL